jgi:integrase
MQAEDHDEARKPDGWIFPTAAGTPMRPSNLTKHFKNVLAAAGLSATVRLHDLRHTTGSTAAAAGVATAAITALLGHASTAITQKLYIHGDGEGTKAAQAGVRRRVKGEG